MCPLHSRQADGQYLASDTEVGARLAGGARTEACARVPRAGPGRDLHAAAKHTNRSVKARSEGEKNTRGKHAKKIASARCEPAHLCERLEQGLEGGL